MNIEYLKITKLYGYFDKEIDFNSDINLLVGINGSGKTSILNIINWVIRPSLPNLCITEFKSINLTFSYRNVRYEVTCKHNKRTFHYKITSDKETYNPLIVTLYTPPSDIKNNIRLRDDLIKKYTTLGPDEKEKKTWDLISRFPNPTVIGLDRNIYTEESNDQIYVDESGKINRFSKVQTSNISPLDRVKEIINKEYRKQKNLVLNLTNRLKNQLMLSTFEGSITIDNIETGSNYKINDVQIEAAEKRVKNYFLNLDKQEFSSNDLNAIGKYFSQLKNITREFQSNPNNDVVKLIYGLNANQFNKIKKLLKEFEKFEAQSNKTMLKIQNFLNTLNFFLKDSSKSILFKEETSELTFNTLNKNGEIITEYKDVNNLSSGEQQILILFSYIAFNSEDGKVFIIDEPELSLHIKWQEDFLEKLEKIKPKSTQLILATHSPILASKKKDKAIVLLPYNE